jgi:hypothetical protein
MRDQSFYFPDSLVRRLSFFSPPCCASLSSLLHLPPLSLLQQFYIQVLLPLREEGVGAVKLLLKRGGREGEKDKEFSFPLGGSAPDRALIFKSLSCY